MHIGRDKNAFLTTWLSCICLGIMCALMYFIVKASFVVSILFFFIPAILWILPFALATCRKITMDERGCKVKYIFFNKYYRWEDMTTCRLEKYSRVTYKSPYDTAAIFSIHHIRKPRWMKPLEYAFIAPPGSFFFVHFAPPKRELYEDKINGHPLLCCVDKQEFLSKMSEWNISLHE